MSRTRQTQITVWSETLMNSFDDDDDALTTKILRVWRALGKSGLKMVQTFESRRRGRAGEHGQAGGL